MKASGVLETHTKSKQIFRQKMPIKLDEHINGFIVKVNGGKCKFYLPPLERIKIGAPIYYEITNVFPLDSRFAVPNRNYEHIYLIVTLE